MVVVRGDVSGAKLWDPRKNVGFGFGSRFLTFRLERVARRWYTIFLSLDSEK